MTREVRAPEAMIRFVLDPAGQVTPDLRRKLPGRGVWVTAQADLVRRAVATKSFTRGFKTPARAPENLAADVDGLLERDALQFLSLANKAGSIVTGAAKVEAALAKEAPAALVHARDGGPDGVRKLRQALFRRWGEAAAQLPSINVFDSAQLDLALGRANVIHAALKKGPAATAFLARCLRLENFRGDQAAPFAKETASPCSAVVDGCAGAEDG